MRDTFGWPARDTVPLTVLFAGIDLAFLWASLRKFANGAWVPLGIAGLVLVVMTTWRKGLAIERRKSRGRVQPVRRYLAEIGSGGSYRRVPGQAVYLTDHPHGTPHALRQNLRHNRLHRRLVLYTATSSSGPRVDAEERLRVEPLRPDITRVVAYYGFMEDIDVPVDLTEASRRHDLALDLDQVTYFLAGRIPQAEARRGLTLWRSWLYALLARNEAHATRSFGLPPERVFEIGTHIPV